MKKLFVALLLWCSMALPAFAVSNDGRIPIVLIHSHIQAGIGVGFGCTESDNAIKSFEIILEIIHARGWTIVPLRWVAEWVADERAGSTMPDKVIAIRFDDGPNTDARDSYTSPCGFLPSAYTLLRQFKEKYKSELPPYSPHATAFVIGSPTARKIIAECAGVGLDDDWWREVQDSGLMEIGNHSADHDHPCINQPVWDSDLLTWLRIGSVVDESWNRPDGDFTRINSLNTAFAEIQLSARYIASKTGRWPTLVAYPYGEVSEYLKEYLRSPASGVYAAFCTTGEAATQKSDRYCLPALSFYVGWRTEEEFIEIVLGEKLPIKHHTLPPRR